MSLRSTTRSQAGFTLVELAIVMIIIGLLIGGVLKGQQLITNAQVAAQVAQFKAVDAAATSFRDMYAATPGDMQNSVTNRLNGCTGAVCVAAAANNNGRLETAPGVAPGPEAQAFFPQLSAANLVTGINTNVAACGAAWTNGCYPQGKITGTGLKAGYTVGNALLTNMNGAIAANVKGGTYLTLDNNPNAGLDNVGSFSSNIGKRLDDKIDDGATNSGVVLSAGAGACQGAAGVYNEGVEGKNCNLYVQIQN